MTLLKHCCFLIVVLCCSCSILFAAGAVAPPNALYIAPLEWDGTLYGPVGCTSCQPTWHIAQWNIPEELPDQWLNLSDGWYTANEHGRVKYYNSSSRYEIAQNGTNGLSCGLEYNLFISPTINDGANYPTFPSGFTPSVPLNELGYIIHSVGSRVVYEQVNSGCGLNYVAYTTAMIFTNSYNNQVFYYQIILRDSRGIQPDKSWAPTLHGPIEYCLDDGIHVYNKSYLTKGGSRKVYLINILTRVKTILQSGDYGIDTNLAHWRLTGSYIGHLLQGKVIPTSQWDSYALTAN